MSISLNSKKTPKIFIPDENLRSLSMSLCETETEQTTQTKVDTKKEPFYFLKTLQKQLFQEETKKLKINLDLYPKETTDTWESLEKAINAQDYTKVSDLLKQLFPESGSIISPEVTSIENPQNLNEKIINIFHKAGFFASKPMPEKLLSWGIGENLTPIIYVALKCGANPEHIYRDATGHEWNFLKLALEKNCSMSGIRLLFQFAPSPSDLANNNKSTGRNKSFSPLATAFAMGRADAVRELLANGADPDKAFKDSLQEGNLFLEAVRKGHSDIIQFFLKAGLTPNYQDENGNTALHFSKAKKQEDIVKDLINAGADPLICNKKGQTYLEYADEIWKQWNEISREKLLLAFKTGSFERVNKAGGIEKVVSYMMDVNEPVDDQDNTLLHIAMNYVLNHRDIVGIHRIRKLIDLKADILRKNNLEETPWTIFQKAIRTHEQRLEFFEHLENIFINTTAVITPNNPINKPVDEKGNTALHEIIYHITSYDWIFDPTFMYQIQELIQKGADVRQINYINRDTPLEILHRHIKREKEYLNDFLNFNKFLSENFFDHA